jgi:hypothetical protein
MFLHLQMQAETIACMKRRQSQDALNPWVVVKTSSLCSTEQFCLSLAHHHSDYWSLLHVQVTVYT